MDKIQKSHLFIWTLYTIYYMIAYTVIYGQAFTIVLTANVIFINLTFALAFYGSLLFLLPKFLSNNRYVFLIIGCIILVAFSTLLRIYTFKYIFPFIFTNADKQEINKQELVINFWNTQIYVLYALGYYYAQRVIQQQREIAQKDVEIAEEKAKNAILEKEKSQAELAFLRSQINPHFMFNTLNMIYNKVRKANKEAGEIVIQFANMMRYATSTKLQANEVDVRGELDFVKEYLNIHKLRFKDSVYIDYDEEGYMLSHRIVPMVLITLVENAIKHGSIDDPNYPLIIRASLIDEYFTFMVHNLKNLKPNGLDTKGNTGVGIVNIEKRLAAVYKNGGYSLEKEETEEDYIVTFTVNFKETKR
ncbi:MAG: sensor histidine kinase [Arcicella sp.]|nr:sensor histidine kinase [Arcicella sp.]